MNGPAVIEWIGPDGEPLPSPPEPPDPTELLNDARDWVSEHLDITAADGPRLGPTASPTQRRGSSEEIVTTLLVDPDRSLPYAARGSFLAERIACLTVEARAPRLSRGWLSWPARVGRRSASLRIGPSPSGNLTVVELVPRSRRFFFTGSFVRHGVPAIEELCERLLLECHTDMESPLNAAMM